MSCTYYWRYVLVESLASERFFLTERLSRQRTEPVVAVLSTTFDNVPTSLDERSETRERKGKKENELLESS